MQIDFYTHLLPGTDGCVGRESAESVKIKGLTRRVKPFAYLCCFKSQLSSFSVNAKSQQLCPTPSKSV